MDNDSVWSTAYARKWMTLHDIKFEYLPPRSPNLQPLDYFYWSELLRRLAKKEAVLFGPYTPDVLDPEYEDPITDDEALYDFSYQASIQISKSDRRPDFKQIIFYPVGIRFTVSFFGTFARPKNIVYMRHANVPKKLQI